MEIYHYVPPELLEGVSLDTISLDEFLYYLAMARTVEDMDSNVHVKAIADVFGE